MPQLNLETTQASFIRLADAEKKLFLRVITLFSKREERITSKWQSQFSLNASKWKYGPRFFFGK